MRSFITLALAGGLALAGLTLTSDQASAGHHHHHHHHSGVTFGFSFGSPYYYGYYGPYPFYRPYPFYSYRYRVVPRPYYGGVWARHVAYCHHRYKSYREYDNTFQPYHGPRRACHSPYIR
jgi:BA14K-like protein